MKMWKRIKKIASTPIPGDITAACLVGTLLGITTVLFISLPAPRQTEDILDESTFGKNESLDLLIKLRSGEELQVKATGATTMVVVQSLKRILQSMELTPSSEKYYPYILQ